MTAPNFDFLGASTSKPTTPTLPGVVVSEPDFAAVHRERTKKLGIAEIENLLSFKGRPEALPNNDGDPDPNVIKQLRKEMLLYGTTLDQHQKAYIPRVSETLYQQITPNLYAQGEDKILNVIKRFFDPTYRPDPTQPIGDNGNRSKAQWKDIARTHSEDAWRLYLGLPQVGDSFTISRFRPANAKTNDVYFKFTDQNELSLADPGYIKTIVENIDWNKKQSGRGISREISYTLGHYQVTKGKDRRGNYVAYYDKWDLNVPHADKIGHPFEVYDRIYYDPKTYKPLPNDVVLHNEKLNK